MISKLPDENIDFPALTRRDFVKILSLSSGAVITGSLAGCDMLWHRQFSVKVDSWHKGVCRFAARAAGQKSVFGMVKLLMLKGMNTLIIKEDCALKAF